MMYSRLKSFIPKDVTKETSLGPCFGYKEIRKPSILSITLCTQLGL